MTDSAEMLADLADLVGCESPSADLGAVAGCAALVDALAARCVGEPAERVTVDGRVHLRWRFGDPCVVLLGHLDTVWPVGTLARWPFTVDHDRATGPGAFDMKAGLVQMFHALASLDHLDGVSVLVTSDEEIGSTTSQGLIADTCRGARAVLVLEPSADGALKTARKGVGMFRVEVTGRAAHAGLDPDSGVNATIEVARQVLAVADLARPEIGTTVTPTVLAAGTTVNTVPGAATLAVDVRATLAAEMRRVEDGLAGLLATVPGAEVKVVADSVRPPLEPAMSEELFDRARRLAAAAGLPALTAASVGGGSDGNLTAALGVPTLDGLGAVGGNAHAEGEWVSVPAMRQRTALVAALVRDLLEER